MRVREDYAHKNLRYHLICDNASEMAVVIVSKLLNLLLLWLCNFAFSLLKRLTIRRKKIAYQSPLEMGKNAETLTAICSLSSTKGQEQSIFKIRCNVGVLCRWKGAVCLSRDTQPTQESLNCTTKGRARGLWCSYLRQRHCSRTSSTKDVPELGQGARGTPKSWRIVPHVLEPCIADCGRGLESLCKKIECLRQPISGQDTQIDAKNHLTWKLFLSEW